MTVPSFFYTAYGLEIDSALPLPELIEAPAGLNPAVTIRFGTVSEPESGAFCHTQSAYVQGDDAILFWKDVGAFCVRAGNAIIIEPAADVSENVLRLFVLGSALGVLLHQRGYMVLHASAVAIDGQVVAFVGQKGFGKSTTAAAFHAQGYPLVTDDLVATKLTDGRAMVMPGFPQLKLWPESAAYLGKNPETLPRLVQDSAFEKRKQRVTDAFASRPLPLNSIFLLADGDTPAIVPLSAQPAFFSLMEHWQIVRLGEAFAKEIGGADFFFQGTKLLNRVPVFELQRPYDLTALPEIIQIVINHTSVNPSEKQL